MRYILSVLVLLFVCFAFPPASRAGFWVKAKTSILASHKVAVSSVGSVELIRHPNAVLPQFVSEHLNKASSGHNEGQTALILGLLGILFFFLSPVAIVFGILGLKHDKQNRGQALAGLILGSVVTFLYLLLALAILFG